MMMMIETDKPQALVLGATGGIGRAVALALIGRGWSVHALHRDPVRAAAGWSADGDQPTWIAGDALDREAVVAAASGVSLIVHAVNPPGYRNWGTLVLPMLDSTILAAERSGARILLPGTIYNYGPDSFPNLTEESPQNPMTRKGAIRKEMERRLRHAADRGVRTLIVRAGDFFGPRAGNNWFSQGLVKPGRVVATIGNPGRAGLGHQWAYLPDVALTMMRLVERGDRLAPFETFHMKGHWDADGTQFADAIRAAIGRRVPLKAFPWWAIVLAAPFVPLFRELSEMRYLWRTPVRLNNARLVGTLGEEPHTPLDVAIRETLAGLGCLPPG